MKIKYTVVYTPTDTEDYTKSDVKYVTFESDTRKKETEVKKSAQREAIKTNTIDSYALRNYWTPSVCEVELIDTEWNQIDKISDYVNKNFDAKHNNTNVSDMTRSIEFQFKNSNEAMDVKKKLHSKFGDILPVGVNGILLQITTYKRTNLDVTNYDDVVKIFNIFDEIKNP